MKTRHRYLAKRDVVSLLEKRCEEAGGQEHLAVSLGVTRGYINNVIKGRGVPGPKILKLLGLKREVVYLSKGP